MGVVVIIPLHDNAETIVETLDSVGAQGSSVTEVIVVDDRSSDDGPALAAAHPVRPRIVPSRAPGPAAARNTGFAASEAPYVLFLDADDLLLPGTVAARRRAAESAGPAVVVGQYDDLVDGERLPGVPVPPLADDAGAAFMGANRIVLHAALTPRSLLAALDGPFDESIWHGEDWAVWLRLACRSVPFRVLDEVDCLYRRRAGSLSTDRERVVEDAIRIMRNARPWVEESADARRLEAERRRSLHRWYRHRALKRLARGALSGAARDLAAALRTSPLTLLEWPALVWGRFLRNGREDGPFNGSAGAGSRQRQP